MDDAGENSDRSDFDGVSSDDGGDEAISRRVVFDERGIGGDGGLQLFERKIRGGFESGVFAFVGGQFAQGAQKLVFVREGFFLELLEAFGGGVFGAELFEFDAMVIPI